jgi:PleD family two-component response regulator
VSTGIGARPYVEEALRWLPSPDEAVDDAVAPAPAATAPSVLIADDNADMRAYLARILGPHYRIDVVADGRAAMDRIHERVPDLVLADVMMPSLDGFGLLREIRGDERIRSVPVVLLSARAGEEARIEGLEAGCQRVPGEAVQRARTAGLHRVAARALAFAT